MIDIAEFHTHQEYPNVSGVIFPDGRICFINVSSDEASGSFFKVDPTGETTLEELEKKSNLCWSDGAILAEQISNDGTLKVVCGEGDYGSDGFVAVVCLKTQKTLWIAASNTSNPFDSVELHEGCVCAKSTLGYIWRFPLNNPCQFTVE